MTTLTRELTLYHYPLGDQARILRSFFAIAAELSQPVVQERSVDALGLVQEAIVLRQTRSHEEGEKVWSVKARDLDQQIDKNVHYIHDVVIAAANRPSHPHNAAARKIISTLFREGLASFVQVKFSDQALLNLELLKLLKGEGQKLVEAMGLGEAVAELEAQADEFSAELDVLTRSTTPTEVSQAEDVALDATLGVIHFVMGAYRTHVPGELVIRERLLVPVVQVNAELHAWYQEQQREGKQKAEAARKAAEAAAKEQSGAANTGVNAAQKTG